jgi:hypothetical protein
MKYVLPLAVLLIAGCAGSRVRSNYQPPQPEPREVREHPEWNPSGKKKDDGPTTVPGAGTSLEDVTASKVDALWHPAWKIIEPLSTDTFEVQQPSNPVRKTQRFEVWRGDRLIGMAIVESAGLTTAKLRLDRPKEEGTELAVGDQVLSRLWMPTRKLHVALHGTYEPPNETMTKAELTMQLEFHGCIVDDKLGVGTDIVIIGSNLLADEWYRKARSDIRFETMKDEDAAKYFDPPK